MTNITLFSQIINKLDRHTFKNIVNKHQSDKHNKGIDSWTHLVTMLFCHFAKANSLREISNGIRSTNGNLNHLGIMHKAPTKSSLSYINAHRSWKIFSEYYQKLFDQFSTEANFKQKKFKIRNRKILLLDSTTITLCSTVFDWAKYHQTKGAIKLHMLLDFDSCMPSYVHMTDGKVNDVKVAQQLNIPTDIPSNSVVVGDRAYIDFEMLYKWHKKGVYFVVRIKSDIKYIDMKEKPLPANKDQHILKDEIIMLEEKQTREKYPEFLRRVVFYDEENNQTIEVITNNFSWTAATIAELYKQRWQIEIFFKMLKNYVKIKTFVGISSNAVLIQIWTALITMLILKFFKEISKYSWSLSNLVAHIRFSLFVKVCLHQWLNNPFDQSTEDDIYSQMQMKLF